MHFHGPQPGGTARASPSTSRHSTLPLLCTQHIALAPQQNRTASLYSSALFAPHTPAAAAPTQQLPPPPAREGIGVKTYSDGSMYDGFWKAGRKHGIGVFRPPADKPAPNTWQSTALDAETAPGGAEPQPSGGSGGEKALANGLRRLPNKPSELNIAGMEVAAQQAGLAGAPSGARLLIRWATRCAACTTPLPALSSWPSAARVWLCRLLGSRGPHVWCNGRSNAAALSAALTSRC